MKKIKKYIQIFIRYFKMDVMYDLSSRGSFFIMVGVETFYIVAAVIFFNILYGNIKTLAGWSYYEMLLLIGIDTVMTQCLVGFIFANGTNALSKRITTGYVDYFLLKPVSSYFFLNLLQPYFPSMVSTLFGFIIIGVALSHLAISFSIINILGAMIIACCGFMISASLMIAFASLSFKFMDAKTFPRIGMNLTTNFSDRPFQVYEGLILKVVFFCIIPIVFLSSVPAFSLIHGVSPLFLLSAVILTILFILISKKIWDIMIINYTSASS